MQVALVLCRLPLLSGWHYMLRTLQPTAAAASAMLPTAAVPCWGDRLHCREWHGACRCGRRRRGSRPLATCLLPRINHLPVWLLLLQVLPLL